MVRIILVLVVLLAFFLGLVFHLQNDYLVRFSYYLGSVEYPFSVFMILGFVFGVLFGACCTLPLVIRLKSRIRILHKKINSPGGKKNNNFYPSQYRQSG